MKMRTIFATMIGLFIAWFVILSIFLGFFDIGSLTKLHFVDWRPLVIAVAIGFAVPLIWAASWHNIIKRIYRHVQFMPLFNSMLAGFFIDNMTPGLLVGGPPTMSYVLKLRAGVSAAKSMSSLVIQMMGWFIGLCAFTIVFLLLAAPYIISNVLAFAIGFIFFIGVTFVFIAIVFSEKTAEGLVLWGVRKFSRILSKLKGAGADLEAQARNWLRRFYRNLRLIPAKRRLLSVTSVMFFTMTVLQTIALVLIAASFGYKLDLAIAGIAFISTIFAEFITTIPGGVGPSDLSEAYFLSLAGLPANVVVSIVMVHRFLFLWMPTFMGAIVAVEMGIRQVSITKVE